MPDVTNMQIRHCCWVHNFPDCFYSLALVSHHFSIIRFCDMQIYELAPRRGGPCWTRTSDLLIMSQFLYQLR